MNTAKLFKNGSSQAVKTVPKEFKFRGDEVYLKKIGGLVILIPS